MFLFNKDGTKQKYDYVKFTNGYRKDSPSFIVEYNGYEMVESINKTYSNGLKVFISNEKTYCIKLGKLL